MKPLVSLLLIAASTAQAQTVCLTENRNDFTNWTYDPHRADPADRDGLLSVHTESHFIGDNSDDDIVRVTIETSMTRGLPSEVLWSYNVLSGHAGAATGFIGYGEAGVQIITRVRDSSTGSLLCSDTNEMAVARYNENIFLDTGFVSDSCTIPYGTTSVDVEFQAHVWSVAGWESTASADVDLQMSYARVRNCTPSCDGSCGSSVTVAAGTCYCDSVCSEYGDCCGDVAEECRLDSCWEQCGTHSVDGSCWCDDRCTGLGDCCSDFSDSCPGI